MTEPKDQHPSARKQEDRRKRQAAALRANLRRRKATPPDEATGEPQEAPED